MERYWNVRVTDWYDRTKHREVILCKPEEARQRAVEIMEYWKGDVVEYGVIR